MAGLEADFSKRPDFSQPLEALARRSATGQAPHVRDAIQLEAINTWMLLALAPSIFLGLYNTGHQANLALAGLGPRGAPGWREKLLAALSLPIDPADVLGCLTHGVLYYFPAFAIAAISAWFWEILFAKLRRRSTSSGFVVTAALFTLLLPPNAPLWQVALGMSFGVVMGKEVFGGTGKNFLNPVLVGLAFLHLGYSNSLGSDPLWSGIAGYAGTSLYAGVQAYGPQALEQASVTLWNAFLGYVQGPLGSTSAFAAAVGALILIRVKIASWRTMAGVLVGFAVSLAFFRWSSTTPEPILALGWYWHLTLGSLAFGTVFLATDPVTSAVTDRGRWVYGMLIGFMVVLIRSKNPLHPDGVILAVLLGNVFAPLIDNCFIWLNTRRRKNALQANTRPD